MDKLKQKAIDGYEKRIQEIKEGQQAVALLPDGMEELGVTIYSNPLDSSLRVDIPFSIKTFRKLRHMFGSAWKRRARLDLYDDSNGYRYIQYEHKETKTQLTVGLNPNKDGAICVKRLVGSKEVPVYEVVCH